VSALGPPSGRGRAHYLDQPPRLVGRTGHGALALTGVDENLMT